MCAVQRAGASLWYCPLEQSNDLLALSVNMLLENGLALMVFVLSAFLSYRPTAASAADINSFVLPEPSRRALMSSVRSMKQLRAAPSRIVLVMIPNVRRQRPSGLPARERVDKQDLLRRVSCDAFVHC